mmetsp:Transcript_94073/g.251870  ORF Transcript_94073/g.251870 Transcript_94073/m.251870 type:complete len:98 (-) Transcript_94073:139-432(-)
MVRVFSRGDSRGDNRAELTAGVLGVSAIPSKELGNGIGLGADVAGCELLAVDLEPKCLTGTGPWTSPTARHWPHPSERDRGFAGFRGRPGRTIPSAS